MITRQEVLSALQKIDSGIDGFEKKTSTTYVLEHEGKRYPPMRVWSTIKGKDVKFKTMQYKKAIQPLIDAGFTVKSRVSIWIEATKDEHHHGGQGWEFGACLWSPTTDKRGARIYENLLAVNADDIVLHLYNFNYDGTGKKTYLTGLSYADGTGFITNNEPPEAGDWSNRNQYYRVNLRGYHQFTNPVPLGDIVSMYSDKLTDAQSVHSSGKPTFSKYKDSIRVTQGAYLTKASYELFNLLLDAAKVDYEQVREKPAASDAHEQHQAVREGEQYRRELLYFKRDSSLVKAAKETYGNKCMACDFDFEETYGELGKGFSECHHLYPLSMNKKNRVTKLEDVAILCANCHRMIHRVISKKDKDFVSLEDFKKYVKS